jgi:L-lactate dehydrogenase complex protein LldE
MGVHDTSLALIESLDNVQLTLHARVEECCGFGGTFALLYPDISEAIVTDKVASLKATPAQCVVSADCGCLLNITGRSAKLDEVACCSSPSLPGEHLASFLLRRTSGSVA